MALSACLFPFMDIRLEVFCSSLVWVYNTMIDTLREEQTRTVEQSYFLEKLIQASPIGIIIMDFDGSVPVLFYGRRHCGLLSFT